MRELYSVLVYLTLFIIPNTRQTSGSNAEETSERYKIEGKITIQGFKPAGKNLPFSLSVLRCLIQQNLVLSLTLLYTVFSFLERTLTHDSVSSYKTSIKLTIFCNEKSFYRFELSFL